MKKSKTKLRRLGIVTEKKEGVNSPRIFLPRQYHPNMVLIRALIILPKRMRVQKD